MINHCIEEHIHLFKWIYTYEVYSFVTDFCTSLILQGACKGLERHFVYMYVSLGWTWYPYI